MTKLVDFHCHLDLYPDFEALVAESERSSVYTLAVTTTPRAWSRNKTVAAPTKHIRVGLGLHPQLVGSHGNEIELWESLVHETSCVGEVGIDAGPQYAKSLTDQKCIFTRILKACSTHGSKILSIHAVRSDSLVMDMMEEHLDLSSNIPVFHWFSGSPSEARRATALGCMFSINNRMLGGAKTETLLKAIPQDRMLTETDGPFTETNGRPSRPKDVSVCVENLAVALGRDRVAVQALILDNLKRVLNRVQVSTSAALPSGKSRV
ncbi:Qat anti-phage system TatD family nuclease QatD [Sinorhizobium meliloti]|uniref:Qat anti-phage system TatD family nuclease QatD n=1 Tax=Rhizobium meliloti TaxID=382 RepID=UPI00299D17BB|nr:TatD family deoxyribonuclease [Sinorhizobium meliloti]